jgi:hypothetical protein
MRHLPRLLPSATELFGADYNGESAAWCAAAFPSIKFVKNDIVPPLPFERGYFNVIYAVSVFTHWSIKQQKAWGG